MCQPSTSAAGRSIPAKIQPTIWSLIFAALWKRAKTEYLGRRTSRCRLRRWCATPLRVISKCRSIQRRSASGAREATCRRKKEIYRFHHEGHEVREGFRAVSAVVEDPHRNSTREESYEGKEASGNLGSD